MLQKCQCVTFQLKAFQIVPTTLQSESRLLATAFQTLPGWVPAPTSHLLVPLHALSAPSAAGCIRPVQSSHLPRPFFSNPFLCQDTHPETLHLVACSPTVPGTLQGAGHHWLDD